MDGNRRRLLSSRVYVIIDSHALADRDPLGVARAVLRGGADAIQLRGKALTARAYWELAGRIGSLCRRRGALFIVNDRPDVALAIGADGVHLGQEDLPLEAVRVLQGGRRLLIGVSTHSIGQAVRAQQSGADYIGVGPVFATPTKPTYRAIGLDALHRMIARVNVPHVAIGGIDASNVARVVNAGGMCVAVVRAVCAAADPERATRLLRETVLAAIASRRSPVAKRNGDRGRV